MVCAASALSMFEPDVAMNTLHLISYFLYQLCLTNLHTSFFHNMI